MNPVDLQRVHVLVVDDDPHIRGLYATVLREAGATVTSSGIATEAVQLTDLERPDVVVTDLKMPAHDGVWLLKELKARMPAVPVIVVSGYVESQAHDQLLSLGFAAILSKPLPLSDLTTAVAYCMTRG